MALSKLTDGMGALSSTMAQEATVVDKGISLERQLHSRENKEQLMKTAKQFEGIFIQQMFQVMDKTIDRSHSLFGNTQGETMFRDMMYEHMGESFATRQGGSGFGLADAIYRQLEKNVPDANKKAAAVPEAQDALKTFLLDPPPKGFALTDEGS